MTKNKDRTVILIVVGTRPEIIKMAPVHLALRNDPNFDVLLCSTGQHTDIFDLALSDFELTPDFNLELMHHGQTLSALTSRAILGIESILSSVKPHVVLVHGDTTTTLASALASFYFQIPVGHVEAGLRTKDIYSPFPEELNRQTISRIARWNFVPTDSARANLIEEGVSKETIFVTGNTIVDSLILILEKNPFPVIEIHNLERSQGRSVDLSTAFILLTFHRRENLRDGLEAILTGVRMLAESNPEISFIWPVHPNQEVRAVASKVLGLMPNVILIQPLGYASFIQLLKHCLFVISDSGGLQEEAISLGKRVILARDNTERPEGLTNHRVQLAGKSSRLIFEIGNSLLRQKDSEPHEVIANSVFGDGKASDRIRSILLASAMGKAIS